MSHSHLMYSVEYTRCWNIAPILQLLQCDLRIFHWTFPINQPLSSITDTIRDRVSNISCSDNKTFSGVFIIIRHILYKNENQDKILYCFLIISSFYFKLDQKIKKVFYLKQLIFTLVKMSAGKQWCNDMLSG